LAEDIADALSSATTTNLMNACARGAILSDIGAGGAHGVTVTCSYVILYVGFEGGRVVAGNEGNTFDLCLLFLQYL